jgi:hypothetical protein
LIPLVSGLLVYLDSVVLVLLAVGRFLARVLVPLLLFYACRRDGLGGTRGACPSVLSFCFSALRTDFEPSAVAERHGLARATF